MLRADGKLLVIRCATAVSYDRASVTWLRVAGQSPQQSYYPATRSRQRVSAHVFHLVLHSKCCGRPVNSLLEGDADSHVACCLAVSVPPILRGGLRVLPLRERLQVLAHDSLHTI